MANDQIEEGSLAVLTAQLNDLAVEIRWFDQNDPEPNPALICFSLPQETETLDKKRLLRGQGAFGLAIRTVSMFLLA
jgi:hypothetical protein